MRDSYITKCKYLNFVLDSWHTAPKTHGISLVVKECLFCTDEVTASREPEDSCRREVGCQKGQGLIEERVGTFSLTP